MFFPTRNNRSTSSASRWRLADALARKLGVSAQMVQNQWDGLVPALQRGNFDIILNGLEITDEHRQQIAMSQPYYVYAQQIVTRKDTDEPDATSRRSKAKRSARCPARSRNGCWNKLGGVDVRIYPGQVEPFRDLNNGRSKPCCWTCHRVYYLTKEPNLKRSGEPFAPGYYGIGVRKEDGRCWLALNQAIAELRADGTLERIYRKWGLWDKNQTASDDYHEEKLAEPEAHFDLARVARRTCRCC